MAVGSCQQENGLLSILYSYARRVHRAKPEQIKLFPGRPRIGKPENDIDVFLGFNGLASQQGFGKTPLPNGIHRRCNEKRGAIDRLQVLHRSMTVDYSVQLDSALDALLFRIFGINWLDAGEQVAELEARSLALFLRTSIRYPKRRIGISKNSNRPGDVRRGRR